MGTALIASVIRFRMAAFRSLAEKIPVNIFLDEYINVSLLLNFKIDKAWAKAPVYSDDSLNLNIEFSKTDLERLGPIDLVLR
ncbi:hypothetical protein AO072_21875 [Pseudomonas syringae ICMP 13102]|nr:hypothetical protein AO072_21875 [Pseudomonas syringae ICMP 13102]